MASETRDGVERRMRALTHLVGQARAYAQQLEQQAGELRAAHNEDDDLLLTVVDCIRGMVAVADRLATDLLRAAD